MEIQPEPESVELVKNVDMEPLELREVVDQVPLIQFVKIGKM